MNSIISAARVEGAPRGVRLLAMCMTVLVLAVAYTLVIPQHMASAQPAKTKDRWPIVPREEQAAGTQPARQASSTDALAAKMAPSRSGRWQVTTGEASVSLGAPGPSTGRKVDAGPRRVGNLPVTVKSTGKTPGRPSDEARQERTPVGPPASPAEGQVSATVFTQEEAERAGVHGVLAKVQVDSGAGEVEVALDYAGAVGAYGGDWASRAKLVTLPECADDTPELGDCRHQSDPGTTSVVDRNASTAKISLAAASTGQRVVMMAVTAEAGGDKGDFGASKLSPAGHWSGGDSSGNFTWAQEFEAPEVAGDLTPEPMLTYSQHAVDGKTTSTNNQPSWVGEGWDLSQGFIERSYKMCSDDLAGANTTTKTGDLCWGGDNATMSFGGHSGELVQDGASNLWRLRNDDGTKVEHLANGPGNGDDNNEYWKVTTADGTQYFFGKGKAHAGSPATNSTWTVPVFGNQSGEPCYNSAYANAWCQQGWRWNLDHVIDSNGNAMVLYHQIETNKYGRNNGATATAYTRGGWLDRIEYGLRAGAENVAAPAKVLFETAERCLPTSGENCSALTAKNAAAWPDVPFDQICDAATCAQRTPSFFTRKRLVRVKTEAAGQEVERWTLNQSFPATNDGSSPALWLADVTHAAAGGANAEPPVVFAGTAMESRVDGVEDTLGNVAGPFLKYRIVGIKNGMGGETLVTYSPKDCSPSSLPAPESNNRRCFPVSWAPPGHEPRVHWFHTYVATQVTETDRSGVSPASTTTHYQFQGDPAWAWNDHPTTKEEYRNWDRFAGYGKVTTIKGTPSDPSALKTETLFYRGLDGDRSTRGGGAKQVTITDSAGVVTRDALALRGQPRELLTYEGTTGPIISAESSDFALPAPRATNALGWKAQPVNEQVDRSRVAASNGWRHSESRVSFDAENRPVQVEDLGDLADPNDDECTRRTYAQGASGVTDAVATEQQRATSCAGWPSTPTTDQVVEDVRTFYDNLPLGQVGAGNVTRIEEATGTVDNGQIKYGATTTRYDAVGREVAETDSLGRVTTTAYTPAGAGLLTREEVTSPDPDGPGPLTSHVAVTDYDARFGTPTKEVEPGGETTEATVDHFGRILGVWEPGRNRATQTASQTFEYVTRADGPNAVTTRTLLPNGSSYRASTDILDGLGRTVQTQEETLGQSVDSNGRVTETPGRILASTEYDNRGLEVVERGATFATGAPSTTFVAVSDGTIPTAVRSVYDGAGRKTKATLVSRNVEKFSATATYRGEITQVTPPNGEAPRTAISDTRGNTVAVRTHKGNTLLGEFDEVKYEYNARDELVSHSDAAGNKWNYRYDLDGNRIEINDPDAGRTTATFDTEGNALTSTNARGETLATTYDALDRKTSLREGSNSGAIRAEWVYDTVKKDHLSESSRHLGGGKITNRTLTMDAAGRALKSETVVPAIPGWVEAPLAKTYPVETAYNADGSPATTLMLGTGPISFERLTHGYDAVGRPKSLAGLGSYVSNAVYSADNKLLQLATGNTYGHSTWSTYQYDEATGQMDQARFDRETVPNADAVVDYARNDAQQLTRVSTSFPQAGTAADTQCFKADHQQRITTAWTPASGDCAAAPSVATLGGPGAYWLDWAFDKAGNRLSEVNHGADGDTTSRWTMPGQGPGVERPHAPVQQSVQAPGQSAVSKDLAYDASGNTTARRATAGVILGSAANDQTLTWDAEQNLASAAVGAQQVGFAYGPEGEDLLRRDGTSTTLYLGSTELMLDRASGKVSAQRHYSFGDQAVAVRSGPNSADVATVWSDLNNTASWQVNNTTSALQTRRSHIYGAERGQAPSAWAGSRGFVQGTNDPLLGLVHVGARDYDPASGRFLSPDPVLDPQNPRQWNAYDYGGANPVMNPDPSGEFWPVVLAIAIGIRIAAPHVVRWGARTAVPWVVRNAPRAWPAMKSQAARWASSVKSSLRPRAAPVRKAPVRVKPKSSARMSSASRPKQRLPNQSVRSKATPRAKAATKSKYSTTSRSKAQAGQGKSSQIKKKAGKSNAPKRREPSSKGISPAPGTRVKPKGIPSNWRITNTKKNDGGVLYRHPTRRGDYVRVMQGNPNSQWPNSRSPYVRWQRHGHPLDRTGKQLPTDKMGEAHIPLDDFKFIPEVFGL